MTVDSIRYCLERATDAIAFEALCCDTLVCDGYESIEPIGGTGDGGRDALHSARFHDEPQTILAYSLRKDWKTKLRQDCKRISDVGHPCERLVFAFVIQPTPNERDSIIGEVKDRYGWDLELYGLERLRTQLSGRSNHLISSYPSIFYPRFFENVAGELVGKEQRDLVIVDHVESDHAFATWLARRLEIAGYNVCCSGIAPLGGLNLDEALRKLVEKRASRYLPILSQAGLADENLKGRLESSASVKNCLLPLILDEELLSGVSERVQRVEPISLAGGWASGLSAILELFAKQDVPQSWDVQSGRQTALGTVVPEPLTKDEPEVLYSNAFSVAELPEGIIQVPLRRTPNPAQLQALREQWAFVLVGSTAFSFHSPPCSPLIETAGRFAESSHLHARDYAGRRPRDVVTELLRRCLELACYQAGLKWCPDRELIYFPAIDKDSRRIPYLNVEGQKRNTGVTGKKSLFRVGKPNEVYKYAVAPRFFASGGHRLDSWELRLRLFVRVTDEAGTPHTGLAVTTRRKAAAKGWFNQHWFAKTLAVIQYLGKDGFIEVGEKARRVLVETTPKSWTCPVAIDQDAVQRMMAEQKRTRDLLKSLEEEISE